MDIQPQASNETSSHSSGLLLDGSWERSGRSPNIAALVGLIGIGAIFFNAESILALIAIAAKHLAAGAPDATGGFLDRVASSMRFYTGPIRAAVLVSEFLFMLVPTVWLVKRWHSSDVRGYVRLGNASILEILLAVFTTLAVIPTGEFIGDRLMRLIRVPERLLQINAEVFTSRTSLEFAWLIIVVCLTPAICEETFFRGYIQRTFERTLHGKSVILVGVLFGLFHFQPLGLVTLSILGILFGYFYYRSKSLFPSMAAHFTNNLVAIAVLFNPGPTKETAAPPTDPFPLWIAGGTLLVGLVLLFLYHAATSKRHTAVVVDATI